MMLLMMLQLQLEQLEHQVVFFLFDEFLQEMLLMMLQLLLEQLEQLEQQVVFLQVMLLQHDVVKAAVTFQQANVLLVESHLKYLHDYYFVD